MQLYNGAQQALQAGQFDAAVDMLARMIPEYQENAPVQQLLGLALLHRGDSAAAAEAFAAAQAANVWLIQNQQFVHSYGLALQRTGEYAAAQQYFLKSIELNQSESRTEESRVALAEIAAAAGGDTHGKTRE